MYKVIEHHHLVALDKNGSLCEICFNNMHAHEWAYMDENGFVLRCSFIPDPPETDISDFSPNPACKCGKCSVHWTS